MIYQFYRNKSFHSTCMTLYDLELWHRGDEPASWESAVAGEDHLRDRWAGQIRRQIWWSTTCHRGHATHALQVPGPRFTKNLKSDRNRKYISGAKMRFTKIIILWLRVFSNVNKFWEWLDVVVTIVCWLKARHGSKSRGLGSESEKWDSSSHVHFDTRR